MEKDFTEKDSLKLINEMITQTRNNFQKGMGNSFLFWGYIVAIFALINFFAPYISPIPGYYIWTLTIFIYIGEYLFNRKRLKEALVVTHIDRILTWVWFGFFISNAVFLFSIFAFASALNSYIPFIFITPTILTFAGLCQFITSKACRFAPFTYGAVIFWIGSLLAVAIPILTKWEDLQFIILCICTILGFIVPGHIANRKAESNV